VKIGFVEKLAHFPPDKKIYFLYGEKQLVRVQVEKRRQK
jgi:hypothetical protein